MIHLLVTSLIWAFSFGLIKANLTGLDSNFVAWARLLVALIVFLPFLRIRGLPLRLAVRFFLIGLVQYGIMYICLIYSYRFLQAHQVALFTIFTPLYVTLINDSLQRRFHPRFLAAALLAVGGTAVAVYSQIGQGELLTGFLIIQLANICFALGQVFYKQTMEREPGISDVKIYAILYLGAVVVTGLAAALSTNWGDLQLNGAHIRVLLYLGAIASGLGFFLWNYGAKKTDIGTLAVFNNLKIPLAVSVALIFFNEKTDILRLIIGGTIVIFALWWNGRRVNKSFVSR